MKVSNEPLINTPVDLSAGASLTPTYMGNIYNYSIQLIFTGSPVGTFKLQCSNDLGDSKLPEKAAQSATVTNWVDIPDSVQAVTQDGIHTWNVEFIGYLWVRVVWTASPGSTGLLTSARITIKGA